MILLIIRDDKGKIFAISESLYDTQAFYIQNNYYCKGYTITKVTDTNRATKLAIMYYELFIEYFYDNYYIRQIDMKPIMDMIYESKKNISTTIDTLEHLSDVVLKNSVIKSMLHVKSYLDSHLMECIDIRGIIESYYETDTIRQCYEEYSELKIYE